MFRDCKTPAQAGKAGPPALNHGITKLNQINGMIKKVFKNRALLPTAISPSEGKK
jgi:hypothetical protein